MKLSDGEKLIAYLIADLMEAHGIKNEIDPSFVKEVIAGDDLWALRWKYNGLFHDEGPENEVVSETTDILTMCRVVENSIGQLKPEELAEIPEDDRKAFVGFDGNEDPHFGVATMLIKKLDRFSEWTDRPLNSHSRTIDKYRRMKRVYDQAKLSPRGALAFQDIKAILSA